MAATAQAMQQVEREADADEAVESSGFPIVRLVDESEGPGSHEHQDARSQAGSKPRAMAKPRGAKALSPGRVAARAQDAQDLREAIEVAGASVSAVAYHLKLDESTVRGWCDPAVVASPASGDIDALPLKVRSVFYAIKRASSASATTKPLVVLANDVMAGALSLALAVSKGDVDAIIRATAVLDDASLAIARSARSGR